MAYSEIGFWVLVGGVLYTYAVYPLLLGLAAWCRARPIQAKQAAPKAFSLVLVARNEAAEIERRLQELTELVTATGLEGEIIVVSDGSTDDTVQRASRFGPEGVTVLELPRPHGKAAALTQGCAAAVHDILVFADVRQTWDRAALPRLLRNFADPEVGAVSGNLVLESRSGTLAGVGLYWRFEKWLRRQESRFHATVGATGAISAVRRELFRGIPEGTLLDDLYWPMQVVLQGYRVVHEREALAYDRLPDRPRDEFRRKVRTLCGNYQLAARLPVVLLPWRNPIWWQFVSHKLLRLVVPWALLGILVLSMLLPGPLYRVLFWVQAGGYLLGLLGLADRIGSRSRLAGVAASFLVLNAAAWSAFWVWIAGRAESSWQRSTYAPSAPRSPERLAVPGKRQTARPPQRPESAQRQPAASRCE